MYGYHKIDNKWEMHVYNFMQYIVKDFCGMSKTGSLQQENQTWELFQTDTHMYILHCLAQKFVLSMHLAENPCSE